MRTFRVLAVGWILGGAVIVLLTAIQPQARALPMTPEVKVAAVAAAVDPDVLVPVAGIAAADLHDNYTQLRGGGTRTHGAIDIMAPRGTAVVAAVDGTVHKLFTSAGGGLSIYQFDRREELVYYYAHLDSYAPTLREGLFVAQGTVIGYVGSTGNATANAPHLHFAIEVLPPTKEWWKGTPVNPYPVLVGSTQ